MTTSAHTDGQVARLARVHDDALAGRGSGSVPQDLLAAILAEQVESTEVVVRRRGAGFQARRFALAAATAGAMTVAVVAGPSLIEDGTGPATSYANSAIEINKEGDVFVARIKDPLAAHHLYEEAFRAVGKNVELNLVPVPPSMVGLLLEADGDGTTTATSELACDPQPTRCSLVIRVSVDGTGTVRHTIGRAARPGEEYQKSATRPDVSPTPEKTTSGANTGGSGD